LKSDSIISVGLVGARGYVGGELINLINGHPSMRLAFAASRSSAGQPVPSLDQPDMTYIRANPEAVGSQRADAVILAIPDGTTSLYIDSIANSVILDLSSDHRFDDSWVYGLCEHNHSALKSAQRISNPGCYATAVQLALRPLLPFLDAPAHAFGVSGYSGAGTTPSPRNDPALLADGITPYALVGHTHEREISHHLGQQVRFSPHVAPFFRGISVTIHAHLAEPTSPESLETLFRDQYRSCPLIEIFSGSTPRVQQSAGAPGAQIGGFTVGQDAREIALVCTLDNLLKGAATQAIQNLNLAFGIPEYAGLLEGALT